jgi:hypothetical protein
MLRSLSLAVALVLGVAGTAHAQEAWLVWTSEEGDEGARTVWLDARGREVASRGGVVVAARGALWEYRASARRVRLPTCDQIEVGARTPARGERATLERGGLVEVGGSRRRALGNAPIVEGAAEAHATQEIVASVGPWLFVRASHWSYECGAHGNLHVGLSVYDARTGRSAVDVLAPGERNGALALRGTALEELLAAGEGDFVDTPAVDDVELVASTPAWTSGRLAMDHHFTTFACYACSDGMWSSYTRAASVHDENVPASLAPYASLPDPVSAWIASHGDVRGVSRVAPADAPRLRARFTS